MLFKRKHKAKIKVNVYKATLAFYAESLHLGTFTITGSLLGRGKEFIIPAKDYVEFELRKISELGFIKIKDKYINKDKITSVEVTYSDYFVEG